ncbi:dihydrofolate reductase [Allocatelliglobosispora scoriae]|uniref:Dihydrofolate reductase n=1 Tax=Allocatelliglobosispora scoriae TaxID=643052 RepID=A0A841C395_9ACTN|nr:dihydrofolate reductase family protein [Allocatelliglobosispora scoriae]MBB5873420.1 dihydrofolate reductase [Allocatelliglobosispora scoriae]
MRKIILMMSISLDGFFEGPDHDLSWHLVDEELHTHFNERLAAMGAFFDGRVTYEGMAEFWPTADADPESSPAMVEFARIWRDMPKVVFSRTLDTADWGTTIAREVDVEEIQRLKAQPGGDIAIGGADLATTFIRHGLIDEFWLYVHPVAIGQGTPWFQDRHLDLRLLETRAFGNGVVLLRYA